MGVRRGWANLLIDCRRLDVSGAEYRTPWCLRAHCLRTVSDRAGQVRIISTTLYLLEITLNLLTLLSAESQVVIWRVCREVSERC
jgi:hypothetical protein